jgi:alpha-tubulin suppressor-like RCC1 family protein
MNGAWGGCVISNVPDSQSKACSDGNFITSGERCIAGACSGGLEDAAVAGNTIASGGNHTCAIRSGGKVYCWGQNLAAQLGKSTTTIHSSVPVQVPGITDAVAVTAGGMHSCALRATGELLCWGANTDGALGRGPSGDGSVGAVTGIAPTRVSARNGFTTCAVNAAGEIWCWGDNLYGQLGIAATTASSNVPVHAAWFKGATVVASGGHHGCAIYGPDSIVACWGKNEDLQLGASIGAAETSSHAPPYVRVPLTGASHVAAGGDFSCARLLSGQVVCWGNNAQNQLGNGTTTSSARTTVSNLTTATNVVAGEWHACALLTSGQVYCWGYNSAGQLGDGTSTNGATPVLVGGGHSDFSAVTAGSFFTCARRTNGFVMCWGNNQEGQIGNGTTTSTSLPIAVTGLP